MTPDVFLLLFLLSILVIVIALGRKLTKTGPRPSRYAGRESGGQMELDMRLPYKRFRELYPNSRITYQEYKKMQMESAFRRAVSSEKNKRMVR